MEDDIDYEDMFNMDTFLYAIEMHEDVYEVDELPIDEYIMLQPIDSLDYDMPGNLLDVDDVGC